MVMFWLVSMMVMPVVISLMYIGWTWSKLVSLKSPAEVVRIKYVWARYGIRKEFEGQVVQFCSRPQNGRTGLTHRLHGKVAVIYRGSGIMHESTLIEVDKAVDAGASAVILVNCNSTRFTPKVITENFMLVRACNIPVISISKRDASKIGEGAYVSARLKYPVILFGPQRLNSILETSWLSILIEQYRDQKRWFCIITLIRAVCISYLASFSFHTPIINLSAVLFIQMTHFIFSLQCPYSDDSLNHLELAASFCCLITVLIVVSLTSILGTSNSLLLAFEAKGTAGVSEDLRRLQLFYWLSYLLVIVCLFTLIYLVTKLVHLILSSIVWALLKLISSGYCAKKISCYEIQKPHEKLATLPDPIDASFLSALHATCELQRVLPLSSLCDCALTAVMGAISKTMEAEEILHMKTMWCRSKYPWIFSKAEGSSGFCQGKDVYIFFNQISGSVVEIAANSELPETV